MFRVFRLSAWVHLGLLAALIGVLGGCATPPQTRQLTHTPPADIPARKTVTEVPFYPQQAYQCGPASLAMVLSHSGHPILPDQLVEKVYVPAREGAFQVEMLAATRDQQRLALEIAPELDSLLRWVANDEPVLVLQNLGLSWYTKWHYAVVIGYDLDASELILHSGETAHYRMPLAVFERTWARGGHWGMVALVPGRLPVADDSRRYLSAAAKLEETNPQADIGAVWRAGTTTWPDSPELAMGRANHLYQQGNQSGAMALFRQLTARHPDYLPAYNNLAHILLEAGETEEAIAIARLGLSRAEGGHRFLEETLGKASRTKLTTN